MVERRDPGDHLRAAPGAGDLIDDVRVTPRLPARRAVPAARARRRRDIGIPALVERRAARDLPGGAPGALLLADHERLLAADAVPVDPARAAVARRRARHREDRGVLARAQSRQTGDLVGGAPGAVDLGDHERMPAARAGSVMAALAAVARPRAP